MTEQEKIQLRYIAIMQQSVNAQNDMERTIYQPANALRILKAQLQETARAIGNVFIPILIKVLPYVIAFVKVIGMMISALAKLVGFELPRIENTFSGVSDSLEPGIEGTENMSDNLDSANKSAKELRKQLMGFDELNVLTTQSDSGGGGVGGLGDLGLEDPFGDIDFGDFGYEDLIQKVTDQADKLIKVVREFIEKWGPALLMLLTAITAIKMAVWIRDMFIESEKTNKGFIGLVKSLSGKGGLIASIAVLAVFFVRLLTTSEDFRRGLMAILGAIGNVIGGVVSFVVELVNMATNFETGTGWATLFALAIGSFMGVLSPVFGIFTLVAGAVAALGYALGDSVKEVDLYGEGISDLTREKIEPFMSDMQQLDKTISTLTWQKKIITPEQVAEITNKARAISEGILLELDSDRNKDLATIDTLKGVLDETEIQRIADDTNKMYDSRKAIVEQAEKDLATLIDDYNNGKIASEEEYNRRYNEIMTIFQEQGVKAYAETADEQLKILGVLNNESVAISQRQASEIIKNAKKMKEDSIAEVEDKYLEEVDLYTRLKEGATEEEQAKYDELIRMAEQNKNDQIKTINEQYDEMIRSTKTKLGDQKNTIDYETGEINTRWNKFWMDLKDGVVQGLENAKTFVVEKLGAIKTSIMNWFNQDVKPWFSLEKWQELGRNAIEFLWNGFNNAKDWLVGNIKSLINNYIISPFNNMIGWINRSVSFSWESKSILGNEIIPAGSIKLFEIPKIKYFEKGGFPDIGSLFFAGENGAELIGKYRGKQTVMPLEDSGFIESMYESVYNAVSQALSEMDSGDLVLMVGEEELGKASINGINRINRKYGVNLLKV